LTYNRTGSLVESRDSISFFERKPAWCREILKETEKLPAPKGHFHRKQKPDKYSGPLDELNLVIDSEPSTLEMREVAVTEKNDVWPLFSKNS
jgi:hypothetical protein